MGFKRGLINIPGSPTSQTSFVYHCSTGPTTIFLATSITHPQIPSKIISHHQTPATTSHHALYNTPSRQLHALSHHQRLHPPERPAPALATRTRPPPTSLNLPPSSQRPYRGHRNRHRHLATRTLIPIPAPHLPRPRHQHIPNPTHSMASPKISFSAWDVRSPPPLSLHGTFDVVHVRLLSVALGDAVKGEEIVRNISMLLKPGGWLQWEEMDMTRSIVATADPSITPIAIPRMDQAMKTGSERSLIPRLGELLSSAGGNGFCEVNKYEVDAKKEILRWSTEMHVLAVAEAAENWPAGGAIQVAMKELVTAVQKEAEMGVGH
ncbi:MAG: hypothetical protein Q9169_007921 [Polycauliona sp. 2 TL-2023]